MKKVLPYLRRRQALLILIVATALLNPLYPVYAQSTTQPAQSNLMAPPPPQGQPLRATGSADLKMPGPGIGNGMLKMEDRIADLKERLATRSAALRQKLARFKDKAKATRVETINENLNTVNSNVTAALQKNLTNIETALGKLKTKAEEAEAAGKDVSSIKADITEVETQWKEASDALSAQMAKDYTIAVETESTVKADAQDARNTLRTDLKSVHTAVSEARKSLADAISNALSFMKGDSNGQ